MRLWDRFQHRFQKPSELHLYAKTLAGTNIPVKFISWCRLDHVKLLDNDETSSLYPKIGPTWVITACLSMPLSACATPTTGHPMLDSGVMASKYSQTYWIDNEQVIFVGYDKDAFSETKPTYDPNAIFIWNTAANTLRALAKGEWVGNVCGYDGYVRYSVKPKNSELELHFGELGKEQKIVAKDGPGKAYWTHPINCRVALQKPDWWIDSPVQGKTIVHLLPEHGYLANEYGLANSPVTLFRPGDKNGKRMPFSARDYFGQKVIYHPFATGYLIQGSSNYADTDPKWHGRWPTGTPRTLWLLHPDGTTREIAANYIDQIKSPGEDYVLVRDGLLTNTRANAARTVNWGDPGTAGLYLSRNSKTTKVVTGVIEARAVSPDGCKLVFLHSARFDYQWNWDEIRAGGRPNTTMKMIDVCKGE